MKEDKTMELSYKQAWDENIRGVSDFVSFIAYLEQRPKLDVLKEFCDALKKDILDGDY